MDPEIKCQNNPGEAYAAIESIRARPGIFKGFPLWGMYLIYFCGSLFLILPAIAIIIMFPSFNVYWPVNITAEFVPALGGIFVLSVMASAILATFYLTLALICIIPYTLNALEKTLKREIFTIKGQEAFKYILLTRFYFALPVAACVFWLLAVTLLSEFKGNLIIIAGPLSGYYITRIAFALFIFSLAMLISKLVVLRVSVSYHYDYYSHRISANVFALAALRRLRQHYPPVGMQPKDDIDRSLSKDDAAMVAESIFRGLNGEKREHLIPSDFCSLFNTKETSKLFSLFDRDGNGDLSLTELSEAVEMIYAERDLLLQSLTANDELVGRLDTLAFWLAFLVAGTLCLPIFDISVAGSLVTIVGALMMAKAIFGSTIRELFNSIVFIFVNHPFDVGDAILINGTDKYKVKEMGWWSSTFFADGNRIVYLNNSQLADMSISNLHRSGPQVDPVQITVALTTTREQLMNLERLLSEFVARNPRDYDGKIFVDVLKLSHAFCMRLNINVRHRSNFQNNGMHVRRRNAFLMALREAMNEVNIELATEEY